MAGDKKKSSNFLVQGSILGIASIISRMIGLIYRIPLTSIIGDVGNDYYGAAMEVYSILLLISSYSLPLAVSKLVSTRVAKRQRANAYRIFRGALAFALVSGTAAGLIVFFGAGAIASLLKTPLSIYALRVLAPTLLIVAVLGVIRGFFQGLGTMLPSAISQLIEQVVNAIVSVWAAYMLFGYGKRIMGVLGDTKRYDAAYGAAGGTIGTGVGALFALLFVLTIFLLYRTTFRRQMRKDVACEKESYREIFRVLILTIIPVLLSTTIYNISSIIDQGIFKNVAAAQDYAELTYSTMWGVFTGKYKTLINVPIALASALASSCVPSVANAFASKDIKEVRGKVNAAIRFVMIIAFPCAVGMAVLASPIISLLYPASSASGKEANALAANLLVVGAVSIIFYSISTVSNAILQGINRMRKPVQNALIALIAHIIVLVILMGVFRLNIYAVVLANAFFSLLMCILNGLSIRRAIRYRQEVVRTFLIPLGSAGIMGVCVYGVYHLLMAAVKSNAIATVLSICVGAAAYGVALLLMKGITAEEFRIFPGGGLLVKIARKMHLL